MMEWARSRSRMFVVLALVIALGLMLGAFAVERHATTWPEIWGWALKSVAPLFVVVGFASKKAETFEKLAVERREAEAKAKEEEAERLAAKQQQADDERTQINDGVKALTHDVRNVRMQMRELHASLYLNGTGTLAEHLQRLNDKLMLATEQQLATTPVATIQTLVVDGEIAQNEVRVSDSYYRLTGLTAEKAAHRGWLETVTPEYQTECIRRADEAIKNGTTFQYDYPLIPIGTTDRKPVKHFGYPLRDDNGRIYAWSARIFEIPSATVHAHQRASDLPEAA